MEDWASLLVELLLLIVQKLPSRQNFVHFSMVCKSWCWAAKEAERLSPILQSRFSKIPLLMIPSPNHKSEIYTFYKFSDEKFIDFQFKVPENKTCSGSSFGWLITSDGKLDVGVRITLFNPSSNKVLHLPPIENLPYFDLYVETNDEDRFVRKAILSADPSLYPRTFEVAIICGSYKDTYYELAVFNSSENMWNYIPNYSKNIDCFDDLIYHKGKLHVMNCNMDIARLDDIAHDPIVLFKRPHLEMTYTDGTHFVYLVETLEGDLLAVSRYIKRPTNEAEKKIYCSYYKDEDNAELGNLLTGFMVFKIDTELQNWTKIDNLGNNALFLGDNYSMCVSKSTFPECLLNSIYYTHNRGNGGTNGTLRKIGIFSLEAKINIKYYNLDLKYKESKPQPVWIFPTLY